MELGQRLRQARLEAGLTQRQVCGDLITRNMLSQIENGTAHPSMETLRYLAEQLGKPVSYFLDEQPVVPNQPVVAQARAAFARQEYRKVLEILKEYQSGDPVFEWELYLLEAQSCIELAAQAIQENRYPYAAQLLERAGMAGSRTPYYNEATKRQRLLLLCRVTNRNITLPPDDEALLIRAKIAADEGNYLRTQQYLDAMEDHSTPDWFFLQARVYISQKRYGDAIPLLRAVEEQFPKEATALLERCFREQEDYKGAYFYACKRRALETQQIKFT